MFWSLLGSASAVALLERWSRTRRSAQPLFRARFADDALFLLLSWVATAKLSLAYVAAGSSLFHRQSTAPSDLPTWLLVVIAIVLLDLGNYLSHFLLHRVDALWEFHKVHHSSPTLDWMATFRSHLVEQLLRRLVAPVALIVFGFPIGAVGVAAGIFMAWGTFNHANLRIGGRFLEVIFITPRLHRLHHQTATSDRNLGTVFTLWDRLRGTFIDEEARGELGVSGESYPEGFLAQMREPFRRLRSRVPAALLICLAVVGCAAPNKHGRPARAPCNWEISGDVPLPRFVKIRVSSGGVRTSLLISDGR
jgi:sterol desaturase/sphingolipid hydroxylase (fatty acid hydroxylase superfamily)